MKLIENTQTTKIYLALGDSMSIDLYTDVVGGGAVAKFYKRLCTTPDVSWRLDDRTSDGQRMEGVNFGVNAGDSPADLITLTVGGNDLLQNMGRDPAEAVPEFVEGYSQLTQAIRDAHPQATVIVGNIYQPQALPEPLEASLNKINEVIAFWVHERGFRLVDIHGAFLGHEMEYLCCGIEPTFQGATAIADLFEQAANQ